MALNDQKICTQLAKKPGSRAVDLADVLDCELIDISNALKALVEVGDVVRSAGTGPNGQQAQFYSLSETFLKSRDGKLILARLEGDSVVAAASSPVAHPPAPAPLPQTAAALKAPPATTTVEPLPAPAQEADNAKELNRVELAISFIRERGTVMDAELRDVMKLRTGQYPSAWLTYALRDGRVRKNGKEWSLGDGVPRVAAPVADAAKTTHQAVVGEDTGAALASTSPAKPDAFVPADIKTDPGEVVICDELNDVPPNFRCGLWSDGVLELRRGAEVLAELTPAEQSIIARHLAEGPAA